MATRHAAVDIVFVIVIDFRIAGCNRASQNAVPSRQQT